MEFQGQSLALSADGLASVANDLGVEVAEIWAVLSVETHGTGFLPDRRTQILFERHVFSKLTEHRYDGTNPEVSSQTQGGYGDSGAHQYDRLAQALALDSDAALRSTSWGLAQIMGFNFESAGFDTVEEMVIAVADTEDAQLKAMCSFISGNRLQGYLAAHDWISFARAYNGKDYATKKYDLQLRGFYAKYSVGAFPDLDVRAAQVYLQFRGWDPHGIDGIAGPGTRAALLLFQASEGLNPTGQLDDATMNALIPGK